MIRIIINGVEPLTQPYGVDKLSEVYGWNQEWRMFTREVQGEIIFVGNDFDSLYSQLRETPCEVFQIELQETERTDGDWQSVYIGHLFLNDVDFDIDRKEAKVTLTDNGFTSMILRNGEIKLDMNIGLTKNGSANPAKIFDNLGIRAMNDATIVSYDTISIYNALDFAVRFCSDNQLSFYSAYLLSNPDNLNDLYLMSGFGLRTGASGSGGSIAPNNITTHQLFRDITRLLGLYGFIEFLPNGTQRVRYENYEYFADLTDGNTFEFFKEIVVSVRDDAFFQTINFGSAVSKFNAYMTGWLNEETYAGSSDCNKTQTVDLSMQQIITDSVVIDEIFNGDDAYDEYTIVIHDQSLMFAIAIGYDPSDTTNVLLYYNWMIRNIELLNRAGVEYCLGEPNFKPLCNGYLEQTSDVLMNTLALPIWIGIPFNVAQGDYMAWDSFNSIMFIPNSAEYDAVTNPTGGKTDTLYRIDYDLLIDNVSGGTVFFTMFFGADDSARAVQQDTSGLWTNVNPILGKPGYYEYLSMINITPNNNVPIVGSIDVIITGNNGFNDVLKKFVFTAFVGPTIINIQAGSNVTITNLVKEEINFPTCRSDKYQLTAKGTIDKVSARAMRNEPLKYQTLLTRQNGYSGQLESLTRNLQTGESEITLNLKNI